MRQNSDPPTLNKNIERDSKVQRTWWKKWICLSNFLQSLYSGYHNKTRNNFLCSNSKYNSKIEEVTDGIKVIKNALKRKATTKGQLPSTFIKIQPVFPNKMLLSSNNKRAELEQPISSATAHSISQKRIWQIQEPWEHFPFQIFLS